jgi:TolA-binding protein
MSMFSIFGRKVRGFRVIEVFGLGLLIAVVLTVYLGKTFAGKERNQIADVEQQIAQEQDRVRMLRAEVAYLEQPARLERLSSQVLGLAPIAAKHETTLQGLAALAHPAAPAAPTALAAAAPDAKTAVAAEATVAPAHPQPPLGAAAARGGLTP